MYLIPCALDNEAFVGSMVLSFALVREINIAGIGHLPASLWTSENAAFLSTCDIPGCEGNIDIHGAALVEGPECTINICSARTLKPGHSFVGSQEYQMDSSLQRFRHRFINPGRRTSFQESHSHFLQDRRL